MLTDVMINQDKKGVAVIGIGNLIMGDEGFGIHVIRHLEKNYRFSPDVSLIDGGTAGIYMAPVFEEVKRAIVVDVIAADLEPGSIVRLSHEGMQGRSVSASMSPHQIGVLEVLEICRFRGTAPERIDFICVVPEKIEPGVELSPALSSRTAEVADIVAQILSQEGFLVENA